MEDVKNNLGNIAASTTHIAKANALITILTAYLDQAIVAL